MVAKTIDECRIGVEKGLKSARMGEGRTVEQNSSIGARRDKRVVGISRTGE